jgi:hypothetical protein
LFVFQRPILAVPLAEFYVEQVDAKLLIEGTELWRSTVVTIGSQRAYKIEVLPNMKGIIAHFKKIERPQKRILNQKDEAVYRSGTPKCTYHAKVIVWTSEGKTVEDAFVRIHGNNALKEDGQSGFDWCDLSKNGARSSNPAWF